MHTVVTGGSQGPFKRSPPATPAVPAYAQHNLYSRRDEQNSEASAGTGTLYTTLEPFLSTNTPSNLPDAFFALRHDDVRGTARNCPAVGVYAALNVRVHGNPRVQLKTSLPSQL